MDLFDWHVNKELTFHWRRHEKSPPARTFTRDLANDCKVSLSIREHANLKRVQIIMRAERAITSRPKVEMGCCEKYFPLNAHAWITQFHRIVDQMCSCTLLQFMMPHEASNTAFGGENVNIRL
jgi:hypothetical protein